MDTVIPILAAGTGGATGAGEWSALLLYVVIALGVSFLCSIWEAAMLSTSVSHIELLVQDGNKAGTIMRGLRQNVEHPISAILTLNTIAHTVGAAGAGAEATAIFGSEFFGVISAILTLLILIFSEIIPKTLGAVYAKPLTPFTAYSLRVLLFFFRAGRSCLRIGDKSHAPERRIANGDAFGIASYGADQRRRGRHSRAREPHCFKSIAAR